MYKCDDHFKLTTEEINENIDTIYASNKMD